MADSFNASTQDADTVLPQFKACLSYIEKRCLKKIKKGKNGLVWWLMPAMCNSAVGRHRQEGCVMCWMSISLGVEEVVVHTGILVCGAKVEEFCLGFEADLGYIIFWPAKAWLHT